MVNSHESTELIPTKPFSVFERDSIRCKNPTREHPHALEDGKATDQGELGLALLALDEGTIHQMGKVGLETDVKESHNCKDLIDLIIALINPDILKELETLHK